MGYVFSMHEALDMYKNLRCKADLLHCGCIQCECAVLISSAAYWMCNIWQETKITLKGRK